MAYIPPSYLYAQAIYFFVVSLWTLALIICATIERFYTDVYGNSGEGIDAGNTSENVMLLTDGLLEEGTIQSESRSVPSTHGKPTWADLLRNNLENLVPMLIVVWWLKYAQGTLVGFYSFDGFVKASLTLQYFFLAFRVVHAVGFMMSIGICRAAGFIVSTLVIIVLSWFSVGSSMVVVVDNISDRLAYQFYSLRILSWCIAIVVTKYYLVSIRAGVGRLQSKDEMYIQRLQRITRNEMESLALFAGFLCIWFGVLYFYILSASTFSWPTWHIETSLIGIPCLLIPYFVARILYIFFYFIGKQPYRSIAYSIALLCLLAAICWAFALYTLYYRVVDNIQSDYGRKNLWSPMMCMIAVVFFEVVRSIVVGSATGILRIEYDKFAITPEDQAFLSSQEVDLYSESERFFKDEHVGEMIPRPDDFSLRHVTTLSSEFQRAHTMDIAVQVLFYFVTILVFGFGVENYEGDYPKKVNGLMALMALFAIFRFLAMLACFLPRQRSISAVVKMFLTFLSLLPLVALMFWGFIVTVDAIRAAN